MARTRGGRKRPFRTRKEYQHHLREMVRQGKGTDSDGSWTGMTSNSGMHAFLVNGYKIR